MHLTRLYCVEVLTSNDNRSLFSVLSYCLFYLLYVCEGRCIHVRSEDELGCCPHFPRCLGWPFLCCCTSGELVVSPIPTFRLPTGKLGLQRRLHPLLHGFKLGPPCLRGKHYPMEPALPSAPTGRTIKLRLGCEGRDLIQSSSADP